MLISKRGTLADTFWVGFRQEGHGNSSESAERKLVMAELRQLPQKTWSHCRRTGSTKGQWQIGHIRCESYSETRSRLRRSISSSRPRLSSIARKSCRFMLRGLRAYHEATKKYARHQRTFIPYVVAWNAESVRGFMQLFALDTEVDRIVQIHEDNTQKTIS